MIDIYREDCLSGMRRMFSHGLKVDIIVTSPPYNLGIEYHGEYDDTLDEEDYIIWLQSRIQCCHHLLRTDGSLFLNLSGKASDPLKPHRIVDSLLGKNWDFGCQNVIHWIKSIAIGDEPCKGHVKPINSPRYLNQAHEYIFHLTKTEKVPVDKLAVGVPYADKSNLERGNRGKNGDVRDRGNVWFIPYETVQNSGVHPATFPLALPEMCIKLHGAERGRLVLDPFMGVGTTMVAAAQLGLNGIGFEVSPLYFDEARNNLSDYRYRAHFGGVMEEVV